jgi:hypothetical protein
MLIIKDGEGNVLTTGNMFYNTLSARQALHRHRRWSRRRCSMLALVLSTSCRDYFDDVDIPDVVSGTDLLPSHVTNLHCIDMHCRCQASRSKTMPNALRGMYLLTTTLRGPHATSRLCLRARIAYCMVPVRSAGRTPPDCCFTRPVGRPRCMVACLRPACRLILICQSHRPWTLPAAHTTNLKLLGHTLCSYMACTPNARP